MYWPPGSVISLINSGGAMAARTSGSFAIHAASTVAIVSESSAAGTHQRQLRYTVAGNRRVKNSPNSRHAGELVLVTADRVPVTADRARATTPDS